MKAPLLIFHLLAFTITTYGQQLPVDSPRQLTERAVSILNQNRDSSKLLFERAYTIADQSGVDSVKAGIVVRYCPQMVDLGENDYARHYLVLIRDMKGFKNLPGLYKSRIYRCFFDVHYWSYSNYDSCLYYALKWVDVAPDSVWKAYSYLEVGASYSELGNNLKALESYNTSLGFVPAHNTDMDLASSIYNNYGMLYSDEHDYKKAAGYFKQSLGFAKETRVPGGALPMLNNLGVLHLWMGEYETSLDYLRQAAALLSAYDKPWATANNIQNQGNVLTLMGRPAEGLVMYNQSMQMFQQLKEAHKIAGLHRLMAEAYRLVGDYKQAEREALMCLNWDRKEGSGEFEKESYQELYKIYAATHQYDKAFDYQNQYLLIVDSLNNAERKTKFGLLEKNYELAQQEKQNQLHLAREEADKEIRSVLIVGSILLAIAAVIAVIAYRRSRLQKEKIEVQAQQLREAAKTKSRFFANVSHELRTPVTLLNGMLELMKESQVYNNGTSEKMEIALGNSRKLQSMLNDVLDLSRVEAGKWELSTKRRELLPLLTRIVLAFESLLTRKNIELRYDANAIAGIEADVDEDKFEKIINNLVYNAMKFNHDGGWIKVSAHPTEKTIVIQVADSGTGIAEKELPHIFDRYYQSATTEKLHAQGIGIGLSLVREFTVLHGGDVNVTSSLNEGSCFTIQLPIGASAASHIELTEAGIEAIDVSFDNFARKSLVLIVEDNEEMRYYLKEILGAHVATSEAHNGRHALEFLKNHKPDLIISDVMMPEMDGYEFLSHLKSNAGHRGIPVVMLTARAAEEDMLQGLSLGVDDYIIKPFSAKELKIRIHNLLTNQEIRREWVAKQEETPFTPTENEMFVEKVKAFVEQNASNAALGIGDLGEYLAMSERQVYRKAATLTGMTPGQLIKEIRLRIAYKLLLEHKITKVADLAQRVGFENSSYFSRQFLERYGKRPTDMLS